MIEPKPRQNIQRVLITGISGSGGSYLTEYVLEHHPQIEIHGISRGHSTSAFDNLASIRQRVTLHECDLTDLSSLFAIIRKVQPSVVMHFASHANVRTSFITPLAVIENNIMGTANLLEAIRLCDSDCVIQLCSTSEVYGQVFPHEVPITEKQPLRPASPYAVSKVTQDLLGLTYFKSYGMKILRTRMFTYINPRRPDLFASSFARQVARIEQGLQTELLHGNLDSVRTIIDVRDAMAAYWLAILHCEAGEAYNIGGTRVISVGEFLDLLKTKSPVPIASRIDPSLLRPSDVTLQIPDVTKFTQITGWKPKRTLDESIDHLLTYWRSRVASEMAMASAMMR